MLRYENVHVWHASLEQPEEIIQKLETTLSEDEEERAARFRTFQRRQTFVVSRGILRVLLSRYTGIQPDQIQLKYTLTGKPFLAGNGTDLDICFNISHAGLLALFAFSRSRQVGIDVACIRHLDDMEQVASQYFAPDEYRRFIQLRGEARMMAFYHCWTRKEAFTKATGDGMYFPLQECEVSFEPDLPASLLRVAGSVGRAKLWSMHDVRTWEGYAGALVVEGNDYSLTHKQWVYPKHLIETNPV